ncbi:acylneuraminate cytidylyltransferase family protein [Natronococcus sp. JC468]|uniref:acylneuraminate cytidylyltransferase family protein n=1 Tax=Natronococcus sp. JC468 TaxID=1961921 RepID=UPI00143886EC|nr:acylneuraminate cytidylyltransferase family protein [Natronococcus sp. JC468]NKE34922.1 acylneuraminate cytidylyltransferase family protein [Natronococcus sp. JC468]
MITAIVPARGGSKGIPRKNVASFLGAPLIAHTIEQSLESDRVDATYVSTDDDEIAATSREAGADVIERPAEIAGDRSPTEAALLHAVEELRTRGEAPEIVVLLQCTSPLRRPGDIDEAVSLLTEAGYDSALSACEDHAFFWREGDDGAAPINYDPADRPMRQEMETRYRENGSIYAVRTDLLEREGCRLGGEIGIHEMPRHRSGEIDTPEDLERLEAIARAREFEHLAGGIAPR